MATVRNEATAFENIQQNSVVSTHNETTTERVLMQLNQKGVFQLNTFAVRQFLRGAAIFAQNNKKYPHRDETFLVLALLADCATSGNIASHDMADNTIFTIEFTRTQVEILRAFLEAKMHKCELERDQRIQYVESQDMKFNADTYVGMKLMLLDIREWLIGTAVSDYAQAN